MSERAKKLLAELQSWDFEEIEYVEEYVSYLRRFREGVGLFHDYDDQQIEQLVERIDSAFQVKGALKFIEACMLCACAACFEQAEGITTRELRAKIELRDIPGKTTSKAVNDLIKKGHLDRVDGSESSSSHKVLRINPSGMKHVELILQRSELG